MDNPHDGHSLDTQSIASEERYPEQNHQTERGQNIDLPSNKVDRVSWLSGALSFILCKRS